MQKMIRAKTGYGLGSPEPLNVICQRKPANFIAPVSSYQEGHHITAAARSGCRSGVQLLRSINGGPFQESDSGNSLIACERMRIPLGHHPFFWWAYNSIEA